MVFHTTVIKHITAYLAPPLDFLLSGLDFSLFGLTFLQGTVVELRLQKAHGILAVLQLLAAFRVFDEDFFFLARIRVFILVAQAHAGLHLVDVLPAGTSGTEQVP